MHCTGQAGECGVSAVGCGEERTASIEKKENGNRFFFFSREEERMHVHVISGDGEAKYWLDPKIEIAKNYHY